MKELMPTPRLFFQIPLVLSALCLSQLSHAADEWAIPIKPGAPLAGKKDCQFQVITPWLARQVSWEGPCKDGKAHGNGLIRATKPNSPPHLFYGVLDHGALRKGVIDDADGGYRLGEFANGVLKPVDDLAVGAFKVEMFALASDIAKAYSQRLQKAGNTASAAFYVNQAKKLGEQID